MKSLNLGIAFLLLVFSSLSFAGFKDYSCDSQTLQGITFRYCLNHPDRKTNQDIVYFLHGLYGDEKTFFTQTQGTVMMANYWRRHGYEPTVVTVSFGDIWLLVNNSKFPLLPFFANQIMPFLEEKAGGLQHGRRLLMGQSMGGFNATEAALQIPGLFVKVALMCPAITTVGPYASQEEIDDYTKRTGASPMYVQLMLNIAKKVFEGPADWDNHDPIKLLERYPNDLVKPRFFVSTGTKDEFGFQEGSEVFVIKALEKGYEAQWVPVAGGHCSFNRIATANFIMGD
ncbi:MAG: alpha/beta hydrolase [Bacillota bacterium]